MLPCALALTGKASAFIAQGMGMRVIVRGHLPVHGLNEVTLAGAVCGWVQCWCHWGAAASSGKQTHWHMLFAMNLETKSEA